MVEISFYDFQLNSHNIQVPLLIVVLSSLGLGFVLAWVAGFFAQLKLKAQIRQQTKTIEQLQGDLNRLQPPPPPPAIPPPPPPAQNR